MQNIGDYLKKFSGFINSKNHQQKVISAEIEKVLGIEIKKSLIEVKEGIAYVKESPIIKNTIFYNKKAILENLQKMGLKLSDIR